MSFPSPSELSAKGIEWRKKGYGALAVAGIAFIGLLILGIYTS